MKRLQLLVALVALGGMAASSYADVQNIRLSGDIRIRGYFKENMGGDDVEDQLQGGATFISQRTRVSVEADLEEHILVVVTMKAEGLWGQDNQTDDVVDGSGAGTPNDDDESAINRRWDMGVTEAYVQFNEMFYSAATLKLGRQYLNYGRGLILSSVEQEYNYDAARVVLDYYPFTLDLIAAELVNTQPFGTTPTRDGGSQMLFANARYEMTDTIVKNIEVYFGWIAQGSSGPIDDSWSRVPPTAGVSPDFLGGASPWIIGVRSDIQPSDNFSVWLEAVYEGGSDGLDGNEGIQAFMGNVGFRFVLKDAQWTPAFNGNYIYASGGGSVGQHAFRPWFDYVDGYNGYVFKPALSNIHIINLGASVKPVENATLSLQGYYYMAADTTPGHPGIGLVGNLNEDNGPIGYSPSGSSQGYGWEIDAIFGYDYSKDVRFQLVYGAFIPGNAYTYYTSDAVAQEVRGEVNVKF